MAPKLQVPPSGLRFPWVPLSPPASPLPEPAAHVNPALEPPGALDCTATLQSAPMVVPWANQPEPFIEALAVTRRRSWAMAALVLLGLAFLLGVVVGAME